MAEAKRLKEWLNDKVINKKEYDAFLNLKSTLVVDPDASYELERLWKALIAEWSSSISTSFDNKKIIKQWIERDFAYDDALVWFNRIGKSVREADFARWLRDIKKWTVPDELNGWLTDDNIAYIVKNRDLTVNGKEIDKSTDSRIAGDFRVRTDIAQIYDAFIIAQKSTIEGVDKEQLDNFVKQYNALNLINKKKYTIFPIRVSGNHWGMFIIGDDESGMGTKAWYTSSGSGVNSELTTVKPLIQRLTDIATTKNTTILNGQKQEDAHNCGVFLIFYIWDILKKQKIELTENYTGEEITKFRQDWQNKIGKEKWCILDSYWEDLRNEYILYAISHPWNNPYESVEDKLIDEIIVALDEWMYEVIAEKQTTSDPAIIGNKEAQIDAIKGAKKPLLDDSVSRKEQYQGVNNLMEAYPVGYKKRKDLENFLKQWSKILKLDTVIKDTGKITFQIDKITIDNSIVENTANIFYLTKDIEADEFDEEYRPGGSKTLNFIGYRQIKIWAKSSDNSVNNKTEREKRWAMINLITKDKKNSNFVINIIKASTIKLDSSSKIIHVYYDTFDGNVSPVITLEEKKQTLKKSIQERLNKHKCEAEYNKEGTSGSLGDHWRSKKTWLDYLDSINQEENLESGNGDTLQSGYKLAESNLLFPLAWTIIDKLIEEKNLKEIDEYMRNYTHTSEKQLYLQKKTKIDLLRNPPLPTWTTEAQDKTNAIKRIGDLMKDDGTNRYVVSDEQLDAELGLT